MDHFIDSVIEDGMLVHRFRCTAGPDAPCRRRPPDWQDRETWATEEATETGHPCWAAEWVEAAGIDDAIRGHNSVLASVPVGVAYDEGVWIDPVGARGTVTDGNS